MYHFFILYGLLKFIIDMHENLVNKVNMNV